MRLTAYNPQKGRLETIDVEFTDMNTTWFEDSFHAHVEPRSRTSPADF